MATSKFALFTIRPGKNNSSHPLLAHGIATPLAKGHDDTKVLHLTQRQSIWRKGAIAMQTPRAPVVCPSRDVPALSIGNRSCILRPAYIAASVLGIQIFVESELLYDVKEVEWLLMIHRLMEKEETALAIIYFDHAARHFSAKSATPSPGIKLVGISNDRSCLIIQAVNALQQVTLHDDSGLPALLQLNWSTLATKATGQEVENCS
jgi:hypothetical protein